MKLTLIGNATHEHLYVPGTPGATERDGGPVHVAQQTLSQFSDVETTTVGSGVASWVDLRVDDGAEPTVVTNTPIRVRGILDAHAFLLLPVAAGEFNFDQLELLAGKIALSAVGLTRVVNSRERHPLHIPEKFAPLLDVLLIPWEERGLVPEAILKDMKKHRIVIITRGDTGADVYDHGVKHSLPSIDGLPNVLAPDPEACYLASFMGHWLRTKDVVPALTFAAEAVALRMRDPQAIPLPEHHRRRKPHPAPDEVEGHVEPPPLLASTGGVPQHASFDRPIFGIPEPQHPLSHDPKGVSPQLSDLPPSTPPLAPGQVSLF